jgi:hypothetical protein
MAADQIKDVPQQHKGGYHDTDSEREFSSPEIAAASYQHLKKRFLNINHWHDYAEVGATFTLTDPQGNSINRAPGEGDHIRIDILGPGNPEGGGMDWVRIVKLEELHDLREERLHLLCQPSPNPFKNHPGRIAHFYAAEASSSFMISHKGKTLAAHIHGRNETINWRNLPWLDRCRNMLIAAFALVGGGKIQWKNLTDGLLSFASSE